MPKNDKIGGKVTLKSIGNDFKKAFSSSTGKKIASTLIHQGIPIVTSTLGSLGAEVLAPELGPVSGFAGAQAGNYAGKKIANLVGNKTGLGLIRDLHHHIVSSARARGKKISDIADGITEHNVIFPILHLAHNGLYNTKQGKGFFSGLKKVAGIAWKHIAPAAKAAGKTAVALGADALGEAVTSYTGNPAFGEIAKNVGQSLGNQAVDSIEEPSDTPKKVEKKNVKRVVKDALHLAKDEVIEPREPSNKLAEPTRKRAGLGIRRRGHHPHHIMGGAVHIEPLESQITYVGGNSDFNTPVQLGSPYQYTYSPAMTPFFNNVNQLQGYNPIERYGGSFVPAGGHSGGSMMIHHIHHNAMVPIARKRGGSFVPAG